MFIFLLIPVVVAVVIYLYLIWPHSHWKNRGIQGPKPQILVGNFPLTLWHHQNIALDVDRLYHQYKGKERFIGVFFGRQAQLFMLDHKLVLDTMVTNFKHFYDNDIPNWFDAHPMIGQNPLFSSGQLWKKRRAEQVPSLSTVKLKTYLQFMRETAKKLHPYIEKTIEKNPKDGFDAKDLAQRFTAENMTNCLYGIEAQAFTDNSPIREAISDLMNTIFDLGNQYFVSRMYPIFRDIFGAPRLPKYLVDFFHNLMRDTVDVRRESRMDRPDILNYFLALQAKKNLSHTDLVAHILTYFGDGTESSSIALANIVFLLPKHQDVQDKLRSEIKEAMSQKDVLEYDDIMNMPYLEQVINEAMRMYPIAVFFTRICTVPLEVENYEGKKFLIQKGDLIVFPIKNIHYDEEFYPNPMEFNPDRFSPELGGSKKYKDMGVYYPFGNGPRQCVGYRLALLQLKIYLIELLAHWKAHLNPRTQKQIEMDASSFLLLQKGGVWVDLERVS